MAVGIEAEGEVDVSGKLDGEEKLNIGMLNIVYVWNY